MLRENIDSIAQATATDLRKPRQETVGEVGVVIRRAKQSAAQLDEWASDETVPLAQDWQKNWSATLLKRPKGVVLVISCVSDDSYLPMQTSVCAASCLMLVVTGPGITLLSLASSH